jgi:hypothetical protein
MVELRDQALKRAPTHMPPSANSGLKKSPGIESGAAKPGLRNGYCFICGLALLVGVNLEPLWLLADMYILLWCLVV